MRFAWHAVVVPALALALSVEGSAWAQPVPKKKKDDNSQFDLRREEAGGQDGMTARSRMRAGDCAGALTPFDNAIRATIEPTLRRDRGLCQEKLGNPYPAIEDFRAYLTARPDAADAEQIRARLVALEEQVGFVGPVTESPTEDAAELPSASAASGNGAIEVDDSRDKTKDKDKDKKPKERPSTIGPQSGERPQSYDYYRRDERLADEADQSALRSGKGFVIGPFVGIPRYFFGDGANGFHKFGYSVGGTIRYSTGPNISFLSELGYTAVGDSGSNTSAGGPLVLVGVELRIPISQYAGDHFLLGGGLGFERYVTTGTKVGLDAVPARLRVGLRHVFGPSIGLEAIIDGGPALVTFDNLPAGATTDTKIQAVLGAAVALVVAF